MQAIAIMLPVATFMLVYAYRSLRAFRRQRDMDCDMEPPPPPTPGKYKCNMELARSPARRQQNAKFFYMNRNSA